MNQILASIPSPTVSYFDLGPVRIHIYALCILTGIVLAILIANQRLTKRGGESGVAAVQLVQGPEVWEELRRGRFSREVFQAAVDHALARRRDGRILDRLRRAVCGSTLSTD